MISVPRRVREIRNEEDIPHPVDLSRFRDTAAWVLLGEPGAGKTTALQAEAEATSGIYLRIDQFIDDDPDPDWRDNVLFLDGLDEIRASGGGDSILVRVRRQLKQLGMPPFRIACRAADWYGSTDREDLGAVSPDREIAVLLLEPLSRRDILAILRENFGIADPQAFIDEAENRGVADLLDNPQTLELLAEAVRDDHWPRSRDETYRLACEKLAMEANKRHRNRNRGRSHSPDEVLDAAGQLCAVLLLSDKTGIALDPDVADERFPTLDDLAPPDTRVASRAIGSRLFGPEGEERVVPYHRSIAEYLAARWLACRIDSEGLPLQRLLNLLLGPDGGVVASLRGLLGWLALHCRTARKRLIEIDPLVVIIYGDIEPMPIADKREILAALHHQAEHFLRRHWDARMGHRFGALADTGLVDDFRAILEAPDRGDVSQVLANVVLDIVGNGEVLPELAPVALGIVRDDTRWPVVRRNALGVWLRLSDDPQAALVLLADIAEGGVTDRNDELVGVLLQHLYPMHLDPDVLLQHLHSPQDEFLIGSYLWFWEHDLPERVPDAHLPELLDDLARRIGHHGLDRGQRMFERLIDPLLKRGIEKHGDSVDDSRLFAWLGIGVDKSGYIRREKAEQQAITQWFEQRPERYKAMLASCFASCEQHEHPGYCVQKQMTRLRYAKLPEDIGLWHLEQADLTNGKTLARIHLAEAVKALANRRGDSGLSLERLESWAEGSPERKDWLAPLLYCEMDWRHTEAVEENTRAREWSVIRRKRAVHLTPHLPAIRDGSVRVDFIHELAGVWDNRYFDAQGETPAERFASYCDNADEVLAAADAGFRRCPERTDLPTVDEIIALNLRKREYLIGLPCLVGMELRWRDGAEYIECLDESVLRCMLAFRLIQGIGNTPGWFTWLVRERPEPVAEVLIAYASAALKARQEHIDGIHSLAHDPECRTVATIATPRLLESFPVRARTDQLHHLESLLKAALRYTPTALQPIIEKKLGRKGMDVAQKVYWYATAALLDPKEYEAGLWRYVGRSEARAEYLADFLDGRDDVSGHDYPFSAGTISKLIELIAPHAQIEWLIGESRVTRAMDRGDQVRALIRRLGAMPEPEAEQKIERLLGLPALVPLQRFLEDARHEHRLRRREHEFRFLSSRRVAQVLANDAPTSPADLAALVLHHLDDIEYAIRNENDDGFRVFWNIEKGKEPGRREENLCRDALLTRLRSRLAPLGVDCQPEVDYANDKRADIRISYRNEFELPIEIKRDSNPSLWTRLREQLIDQYTIAPKAHGYGIYLVLWFGGLPCARDGGKKPRSPDELRQRLENQLDRIERQRVFVRVLDVSWPK